MILPGEQSVFLYVNEIPEGSQEIAARQSVEPFVDVQ
jgi:hypothetical protein